jgi:hypothetical protein
MSHHCADRLSSMIVRAITADEDPRTLIEWSRAAGVSVRSLQYACSAAGASSKACRDLARVLRLVALTLRAGWTWDPLGQLKADPRTVERLMQHAGLSRSAGPLDLERFLSTQSFVRSPSVLGALRQRLVP